MSPKVWASLKSLLKFLGYGAAALILADVTQYGLCGVKWPELGQAISSFVVVGILKALMTWWKTEEV